MTETILTKAAIKKITSGNGIEIVLTIKSSVSLDDLHELKQRDEFFVALGVSQAEVRDYLEPRRGYHVTVDRSGVVQTVEKPADEEGEQLEIEDVEASETSSEQGCEEINDELEEQSDEAGDAEGVEEAEDADLEEEEANRETDVVEEEREEEFGDEEPEDEELPIEEEE
ncbi:hypothetical protein [Paenibacillus sedimenti]|uniref:Uncharacterized protein n=1 Tax=Paenibacillus sedimenti TaxID=2770274 RepID=A0A926QJZ4_9BACL|nr:hypothetical protein [Paenibacillus sedimenti]MBD0381223.1 hypothetical protein [Paenibacillus sedimenti]